MIRKKAIFSSIELLRDRDESKSSNGYEDDFINGNNTDGKGIQIIDKHRITSHQKQVEGRNFILRGEQAKEELGQFHL